MLDSILLFIHNPHLLQVYHEKLSAQKSMIVPVSDATTALLFLSIASYSKLIIYTTDLREIDIPALLRLRHSHSKLQGISVLLLTDAPDSYRSMLLPHDGLIDITKQSEKDIIGMLTAYIGT